MERLERNLTAVTDSNYHLWIFHMGYFYYFKHILSWQSPLWSDILAFKFIINLGEAIGRGAIIILATDKKNCEFEN